MGMQPIAVFDVCGTITKTNNTSDFIGFVLRRDRVFRYGLFLLVRAACLFRRLPGLRRVVSGDRLRNWQIALLRGCSATRLWEVAELYVDALLAGGLLNRQIVEAIQREAGRGNRIVLVSAAVDPPIAAIAGRLGVQDFFASELETANGVCTGRLKSDLLDCKEVVLGRMGANAGEGDSSVYSDNPGDAAFMNRFARRYIVLNTSMARRMWRVGPGQFDCIVNYETPGSEPDVDSINERTVKWVYIPFLYYAISRFHRAGLYSFLFREMLPVALAGCLFTGSNAFSLVLIPLSFLMFYCVYEIGGLVNDLGAKREPPGTSTRRISPKTHIHVGLFVAIRMGVVALLLSWLPLTGFARVIYAGLLGLCLAIYCLHTALPSHLRVFTVVLLKGCRSCIPLAILVSRASSATLAWLCAIFFLLDAPWRVYMYCRWRGLVSGRMPVWQARCVPTTILCGLGGVIFLSTGFPYLLAVASYYVVLDGLWLFRVIVSRRSRKNLDPIGGGRELSPLTRCGVRP